MAPKNQSRESTSGFLTQVGLVAICATFLNFAAVPVVFGQDAKPTKTVEEEPLSIPIRVGRRASPFGHYLAARHAEVLRKNTVAADLLAITLSRYPKSTGLQDARLSLLAAEGRIDEASILAETVLSKAPDNIDALRVQFFNTAKSENWDELSGHFEDVELKNFDQVLIPLMQSWAAVANGDSAEAVELIQPLTQFQGLEILVSLQTALIHDASGQPKQAGEAYAESLELVGTPTLRLAELLGNFYERQGMFEEAKLVYDDLLAGNEHEVIGLEGLQRLSAETIPVETITNERQGLAEILYHLAGILFSERSDRLSTTLGNTALYLDSSNHYYRLQSARMTQDQGRKDKALEIFQEIPAESGLYVRARILAIDLLFDEKRWDEAQVILEDLMNIDGQRFASLTKMGDMYRYREKYEEAVKVYDEAIATIDDPQKLSWFNYYYAGIVHERAKNWSQAERLFMTALELENDQPLVLNYLAYSWVEQGRNLEQSLGMLKTAVAKRPKDGYIVDSLGWVFYKLKRYEEAVTMLERAVALRPGDAVINDHLGDAYFRVGRIREAEFQWRRALSFKPDEKEEKAILKKLETGVVIDEVIPVTSEGDDASTTNPDGNPKGKDI